MRRSWTTRQRLDALYLAALAPTDARMRRRGWCRTSNRGGPSGDSAAALADVFWVLLNSSEFILNH